MGSMDGFASLATMAARGRGATLAACLAVVLMVAMAIGSAPARAEPHGGEETVEQALCRLIEAAAGKQNIPVGFLTQLIWQESSFRPGVVSPAGAQGVAQFMPGTARERGLDDPFDPEQAVPASAAFIAELRDRFGNLGLAAAAYNGGPTRVANWLQGTGGLPFETENYVLSITGRSADDWKADLKAPQPAALPPGPSCATRVAERRVATPAVNVALAPFAPWGVQLAANFSKARALALFSRASIRYASVVGDARPMIIGTRLRSRGSHAFYRVRLPAPSRVAADALCAKIRSIRGACLVLRS